VIRSTSPQVKGLEFPGYDPRGLQMMDSDDSERVTERRIHGFLYGVC